MPSIVTSVLLAQEPLAGLRATPGRAEGKGLSARFETLGGVASDGVGSLYVEVSRTGQESNFTLIAAPFRTEHRWPPSRHAPVTCPHHQQDDKRIRRVQLPAEWRRAAPRDHGSGSATPAVTVSTLHTSADRVDALAYDGATDSLVFASDAKLFRLPLRRAAAAAANGAAGVGAGAGPVANGAAGGRAGGRSRNSSGSGRSGAAAAAARLEPQLIAGGGHSSSGAAPKDFEDPLSIAVDGDGNIFVLDRAADDDDDENIDCCIKVIRGGGGIAAAAAASTSAGAGPGAAAPALCAEEEAGGLFDQLDEDGVLVSGIPVDTYMFSACMTVLRNGSLVVACPNDLVALWLGLKPTLLRPRVSAPAAAPPRSLASDLGALLESPPDATSDLTLCVGGRKFAVHRAILAARCDYFRQRLAADTFADGAAAELELPDADADAFALLLRWLYTGAVELPAAAGQLQFIAELADRLLLPDLSAAATHKLLAAVTPATVVDAMLWAERQGEAGAALLAQLKEWYLEHDEQVVATARDSLKRLAVASPDLMVELHVAKKKRRARVFAC